MSIKKYTKVKLLFGKDKQGKECVCKYDNPGCSCGYRDKCEVISCLIDKFSNMEECFNNKDRRDD